MGSLEGVALVGALEEWLGRPLDATITWDYPTISALARHLADGPLYPEA
jgi:acyl carrier protein